MPNLWSIQSIIRAIDWSPEMLHAVSKLSWDRWREMISCCMESLNPSRDVIKPSADMTPPPGTPGAANIVTPSIKINGRYMEREGAIPFASRIPMEPMTRQMVSPAKWMVAPRGMTNSEISFVTSFFSVDSRLTGMVEAEDWVPRAVK